MQTWECYTGINEEQVEKALATPAREVEAEVVTVERSPFIPDEASDSAGDKGESVKATNRSDVADDLVT